MSNFRKALVEQQIGKEVRTVLANLSSADVTHEVLSEALALAYPDLWKRVEAEELEWEDWDEMVQVAYVNWHSGNASK